MEQELLEKLINHALKLLSRRQQSEKELRDKLTRYLYKKKVDNANLYVDEVISFLNRKKLLNDTLYAEAFVRDRLLLKPRSSKMLRLELGQKGISNEEIEKILEDYDEEEALKRVAEKKRGYPPEKLKNYLLQQGFPYELIRATMHELKSYGTGT
jgi:regulatory protein